MADIKVERSHDRHLLVRGEQPSSTQSLAGDRRRLASLDIFRGLTVALMTLEEIGQQLRMLLGTAAIWLISLCLSFFSSLVSPLRLPSRGFRINWKLVRKWVLGLASSSSGVFYYKVLSQSHVSFLCILAAFFNGWYYRHPRNTLINWIREHIFIRVWHSRRVGVLMYVIFAEILFWGLVTGVFHIFKIYWKL